MLDNNFCCQEECEQPKKCREKNCCVDVILTILIAALAFAIGAIIGIAFTVILQPVIIITSILVLLLILRIIMLVCNKNKCC